MSARLNVVRSLLVCGPAEPTEGGFRVWPSHLPGSILPADSWLYIDAPGLQVTGVCVVMLLHDENTDEWEFENVGYDPNPQPPGHWRKGVAERHPARWVLIDRRTSFERILADD